MSSNTTTTRFGTLLFRLRSFTPVPVILFLLWRLAQNRAVPGPGGAAVDEALNWVGLVVAWAGQVLRFYTLGQVRDGTSGQDNVLISNALNHQGPYAHVRNPLYVGNLGITLGLLLIAHDVWVYAVGLGFFFGEYFFIIRAEEAFLREKHGAAYEEFLAKVPRWIPRLTAAYPGKLNTAFNWSRALKKEHNPFAAWAIGAIVLLYWEWSARAALSYAGSIVLVVALILVVFTFAIIKAYKRRWLFANRGAPGRAG